MKNIGIYLFLIAIIAAFIIALDKIEIKRK